jgi:hypothetical protein
MKYSGLSSSRRACVVRDEYPQFPRTLAGKVVPVMLPAYFYSGLALGAFLMTDRRIPT